MKIFQSLLWRLLLPFVIIYAFPWIFPNEFYIHLAQTFLIYYIIIVGLNILVGLSGQLSLGHVGFYALGAYLSAIFTTDLGLNFFISIILASLLAAGFGALVALLSLRSKGPYLAMVTIAFGELISIIANRWTSLTGGPAGYYPKDPIFFGFELNSPQYLWFIGILAILITAGAYNIFRGRYGRTFKAIGNSEIASGIVGVNVRNWKIIAFAISAFLGGIGGGLYAFQNGFISSTTFEFDKSILFLIGVIIGGSGTLWGPVIGTAVVVLLPQLFQSFVDFHLMIFGGILLLSLVILPEGIVGELQNTTIYKRLFKQKNLSKQLDEQGWLDAEMELPSSSESHILQTEQLSMHFGGLKAVDNLNIEIKGGTIHGIIGPNGSGKSTTVNMLSGVYVPTNGSMLWKNKDITKYSAHEIAREGITRTFQNLELFQDLSVLDNVKVGFHQHFKSGFLSNLLHLPLRKKEEEAFERKALGLLKFVGLEEKSLELAENLSYGEKRLVEIARALAVMPSLLILDEPAAGASHIEIEKINKVIQHLKDAGLSIILIEHHMEIVMNMCDTITVLDFGRKICEGPPHEVRTNPMVIEAYLGGEEVTKLVSGE
jgi:ABC-type branched-subunit amino acid transport system ATPase component/ABC-type branched-subunit amino acid transport system permease subunit